MSSSDLVVRKRSAGDSLDTEPAKRQRHAANTLTATLFNDPKYSDLTITCDDQEFKVHRVILVSRCGFFEKSRGGSFVANARVINMDDDDPEALEQMLRYLYTSSIEAFLGTKKTLPASAGFLNRLVDLFLLADKYGVPDLGDALISAYTSSPTSSASQIMRAYMRIIELPQGITGLDELLIAAEAGLTSIGLNWRGLLPEHEGIPFDVNVHQSVSAAVAAVAKNPEAAVYLISQLGNAMSIAQQNLIDYAQKQKLDLILPEDESSSVGDKESEGGDDTNSSASSAVESSAQIVIGTFDAGPSHSVSMQYEEDTSDDSEDSDYISSDDYYSADESDDISMTE